MTGAAIWTNPEQPGGAWNHTDEIWPNLARSGQFWTNLNT